MKFNVGLIGLGNIGALYDQASNNIMTHLKAVIRDNRFSLSFAYDPSDENCSIVRKYYGISDIYNELSDLKNKSPDIDLLVIASPTHCHLSSIKSLLQFVTPRMILCEKPLAENLSDGQQIADLCNQKDIVLITNYMRRSLPLMGLIKVKIAKQFSSQHDVVIKYSGCFKNNGSHFVDLMSYFYGFPEHILQSSFETGVDSHIKVRATIKHKNALCTYIPMTSKSLIEHEVEIMTDKFKIIIGRAGRDFKIHEACDDTDFIDAISYGEAESLDSDYLNFQKYVYDDIYLALESRSVPSNLCDIDSSLRNTQFIQDLMSYDD
jgi:predicted dehydrogenase